MRTIVCLTMREKILPAFADHPRVLGFAVQDLVHYSMHQLQRHNQAARQGGGQ